MNGTKSRLLGCLSGLVFCVIYAFGGLAFADAPISKMQWKPQEYNPPPGTAWFDSGQAACEAARVYRNWTGGQARVEFRPTAPTQCWWYNSSGVQWETTSLGTRTVSVCANGSAPDTTKPTNQQCAAACPAGTNSSEDVMSGWKTGPDYGSAWAKKIIPDGGWGAQSYCKNGCTITPVGNPDKVVQNQTKSANGYYGVVATGTFTTTGASCTSSPDNGVPGVSSEPTTKPPEKNLCPLGTQNVGTDSSGTPICKGVDPNVDTGKKNTTEETKQNADGSTTTTKTNKTTNSDGSETTETTTCNTAGGGGVTTCSTTTATGNKGDGTKGTDDSSDANKDKSFCAQNPNLNICKNSQVSGTCGSIQCSGDAIACASYRAQVNIICDLDTDPARTDSDKFKSLAATPADAKDGPTLNKVIDVKEEWDKAQAGVAGRLSMLQGDNGCPAPLHLTIASLQTQVDVPLDTLCAMAKAMRVFVILAAGMVALRIMMRINS